MKKKTVNAVKVVNVGIRMSKTLTGTACYEATSASSSSWVHHQCHQRCTKTTRRTAAPCSSSSTPPQTPPISESKGCPPVSWNGTVLFLTRTKWGQAQLHRHICHSPIASPSCLVCRQERWLRQVSLCLWRRRTSWRSLSFVFFLVCLTHQIGLSRSLKRWILGRRCPGLSGRGLCREPWVACRSPGCKVCRCRPCILGVGGWGLWLRLSILSHPINQNK